MARQLTRAIFNAIMFNLCLVSLASAQEQGVFNAEDLEFRDVEEQPDETGLRLGSFQINSQVEVGISHQRTKTTEDSNETTQTFSADSQIVSQWSRHELRLETRLDAASRRGLRVQDWTIGLVAGGRRDISGRLSANGELRLSHNVSEDDQDETNYGATAGFRIAPGPLEMNLRGSADFRKVGDPVAGSENGNDFRDFDAELRLAYNRGAILAPFVETRVTHRRTGMVDGFDGDATRWELRTGLQIDRGEKLTGEVSVGIGHIRTKDSQRDSLNSLLWATSLAWSPMRLTTITLSASTDLAFSQTTDLTASKMASGIRSTGIALRAERSFNHRLDGFASADYNYSSYGDIDRSDETMLFSTGLTYALTPDSSLFASFTHERSQSSGSDQAEDDEISNGLAVRLQITH